MCAPIQDKLKKDREDSQIECPWSFCVKSQIELSVKSKLIFELFDALCANSLAVEVNYIVRVAAEYASGLIFLKDYFVVVGEYLDRVSFVDVKYCSKLLGKHYSSKLVYFSYYTG